MTPIIFKLAPRFLNVGTARLALRCVDVTPKVNPEISQRKPECEAAPRCQAFATRDSLLLFRTRHPTEHEAPAFVKGASGLNRWSSPPTPRPSRRGHRARRREAAGGRARAERDPARVSRPPREPSPRTRPGCCRPGPRLRPEASGPARRRAGERRGPGAAPTGRPRQEATLPLREPGAVPRAGALGASCGQGGVGAGRNAPDSSTRA